MKAILDILIPMTTDKPTLITKELLTSVLLEQLESFSFKDLGIKREILSIIKNKLSSDHVIVITGLRRVGKSTLLAQIARKHYSNQYHFVSFEDERLLNFSVQDFDLLYETLDSLFGDKKVFLFDEIQNVLGWERFVRRMHDAGHKFIITGSNASMLSQELGSRLTGRYIKIELFPFSFREYCTFCKVTPPKTKVLTTKQKGKMLKLLLGYLGSGGIPDHLKYPSLNLHKTLYDDVLYRDIASRYNLDNTKSLQELTLYLMSNTATLISYNKLKDLLKLGSVNTVKSYIGHLENSWLFFVINKYAYSIKEQQIASKKVYSIDTGLAKSVGFSFSENKGRLLENLVFLNLRQSSDHLYYYKTSQNTEVDFYLPQEKVLLQVAYRLDDHSREREISAITTAHTEKPDTKMIIVTESQKEVIKTPNGSISVIPVYEWLLHH